MRPFFPLFDDTDRLLDEVAIAPTPGVSLHTQTEDFRICVNFLVSYNRVPETFKSYRREIERLCHWSWRIKRKSISELTSEDVSDFIQFCKHPPAEWVSTTHSRRFVKSLDGGPLRVPNNKWRPFVCKGGQDKHNLTSRSLQAIYSILSTFYNYLVQKERIGYNPVSQIRQKTALISTVATHQVMRLSMEQWKAMLETADQISENEKRIMPGRTRYILALMFGLYPRISELVPSYRGEPTMGDFKKFDGMWWITFTGKRNKVRQVPVGDEVMEEVVLFRESLGLSGYPEVGESTPLVPALRGGRGITSTRQIRNIVDECMHATAARLRKEGRVDDADNLEKATVHWLRHTGISEDVKKRPLHHVRDDAGHGDISTTGIYMNPEDRERYESAQDKKIR